MKCILMNKNKEVFKGGNTPRITEINQSLKENNDKLYDAYGYKMEINGDESKYSALNFSRSANRYSRLMAGNPRQQDVSRMRKLDDFSENIR